MTKLVCIAGGSGAGKSTLADALVARLGERNVSVLRLDDFQRGKSMVPIAASPTAPPRRNYDHPSAVDWEPFIAALRTLKAGHVVSVTRRLKKRPTEDGVEPADTVLVQARPLVVVEGYLALWNDEVRSLYDASIFLRASEATRVARRRWVKDAQYVSEVLLPMHGYFIEPTAAHASLVVDIDDLSPDEVCERATAYLMSFCGA